MLCENPLIGGNYISIIHNYKPFIKANLYHLPLADKKQIQDAKETFPDAVGFEYAGEYIFLAIEYLEDEDDTQENIDKIARIMKRMAKWYKAYLIWVDQKIAEEDDNIDNDDF